MIAVQNLTKTFRVLKPAEGRFSAVRSLFAPVYTEKRAVDDLSFSIDDGEIVGYIGQNGAGKSTTIKMLAGILVPTAGTMRVNGLDPIADHNRHLLGIGTVFGQRTSLWWDVPLMDSLRILKEMYRVDDAVFRKNVEKFTDILELSGFLHQPVRQLSLGQRMRADLAAAMIHSPRVLFLDEPTIGLDVIARQRLREFIQEINRESDVTILLTTHDMVEMERLASRILVIDQGRLIFSGDVAGLRRAYGYERSVRVEFAGEAPALELEGAQVAREAPDALSIAFDARRHSVGDVLAAIRQTDARIHDVTVHDTDIDQIVRNIYTRREA